MREQPIGPGIGDSALGYDCGWVAANDKCPELADLELQHVCGCTCGAGAAQTSLHAPTAPMCES
eukprot:SAG22_NODE_860_length_6828_cov_5.663100_5_plen_64_part_00